MATFARLDAETLLRTTFAFPYFFGGAVAFRFGMSRPGGTVGFDDFARFVFAGFGGIGAILVTASDGDVSSAMSSPKNSDRSSSASSFSASALFFDNSLVSMLVTSSR